MVTPADRRAAARHVIGVLGLTERRACRLVGISRTVARYESCRKADTPLRSRLKGLAEQYPRYGYPTLHEMLVEEGLVRNRKRTYRIYREERLQVRTKRRKKLQVPRVPMAVPTRLNERWSMDFVSDQLASGRRFRVLNVIDDFSRECIGQVVDTSISGARVTRLLDKIIRTRGRPRVIVSDNGPEFTGKAMFFWSQKNLVRLHFIQPGKPTQNAFVESFNGKFRDHCLNQHWFSTMLDARETIDTWRHHYNEVRPHRSLDRRPPAVFARQAA